VGIGWPNLTEQKHTKTKQPKRDNPSGVVSMPARLLAQQLFQALVHKRGSVRKTRHCAMPISICI
jgi:hypothetical protein